MPPPPRNPTIVNNMLQLHTIKPNPGAKHRRKRLGNGESSGLGKTCGKGNKGQKARSGGSIRPGFEGGQMPLQRRIPKRGFKNIFATKYASVNVEVLSRFEDGAVVDTKALQDAGIVKKTYDGVKFLGRGEVTKKLTVKAAAFSEGAKSKIEAAGGKAEVV